ncbi:MAG: hypothetical protein L3J33_01100 [Rhodobacteraceae bacterium]|nr:hypothetical protein [Paracoccaceae bacterium]
MLRTIYFSYRAMPVWVQIWVFFVLAPVNMAAIFFINEPMGIWIAVLAIGAMLPNLPVIIYDRGFSKLMAFPHLLPWTLLVLWLVFARPEGSAAFGVFLWVLLIIDAISLAFDYPDAIKYLRGDRSPAR